MSFYLLGFGTTVSSVCSSESVIFSNPRENIIFVRQMLFDYDYLFLYHVDVLNA